MGARVMVAGSKSGPCPKCGSMGSIPDGLYEFVGVTRQIIEKWPAGQQQRLATQIKAAERRPQARDAVMQAISAYDELRPIAQRFLVPRNAGEFWAMIAALLAAIALITGLPAENVTYNEHTTNIKQITQARGRPTTEPESRPEPPPKAPKRSKPKSRKQRKKS